MSDVGTWKKRGLLGGRAGNARALLRPRRGRGEEQIKISVAPCEPEAKPERALPPSARPRAAKQARGGGDGPDENPARACERGSGKRGGWTRRRQMRLFTRARKAEPPNVGVEARSARRARIDASRSLGTTPRALSESSRATSRVRRRASTFRWGFARVRAVRSRAAIDLNAPGGCRDRAGNRAGSGDGVRHVVVNAETPSVGDVRFPSSETLGRSIGRTSLGRASEGVRAKPPDVAEKAKSEAFPALARFFQGPTDSKVRLQTVSPYDSGRALTRILSIKIRRSKYRRICSPGWQRFLRKPSVNYSL